MTHSRRDLAVLVPALLAAHAEGQSKILPSQCYVFDQLPVKTNPKTHGESRQVFRGETHKGYPVDLHITKLMPGQMPHAAHHHEHEEMMFVQEGMLEATINGKSTTLGPGGVVYVKSMDEHGLKNTGAVPAKYFVFAIGDLSA
jgi:mannose-6-phosphate isomerase-like protein (cupin superfamily)